MSEEMTGYRSKVSKVGSSDFKATFQMVSVYDHVHRRWVYDLAFRRDVAIWLFGSMKGRYVILTPDGWNGKDPGSHVVFSVRDDALLFDMAWGEGAGQATSLIMARNSSK
ncbi:hypothetical protein EON81_28595 [bacterium]|nr:MAG: hypothetical protein EON81_28595 [bacterium]